MKVGGCMNVSSGLLTSPTKEINSTFVGLFLVFGFHGVNAFENT